MNKYKYLDVFMHNKNILAVADKIKLNHHKALNIAETVQNIVKDELHDILR